MAPGDRRPKADRAGEVSQSPVTSAVIGGPGLREQDAILATWFERQHCVAAVVRPDHYVYGVVETVEEIAPVLAILQNRLAVLDPLKTKALTAGPSTTLPADFLWNLVASANFMRLSLRRGANAVLYSAAWQEIRVRSGRDDNFVAKRKLLPNIIDLKIICHPDRSAAQWRDLLFAPPATEPNESTAVPFVIRGACNLR